VALQRRRQASGAEVKADALAELPRPHDLATHLGAAFDLWAGAPSSANRQFETEDVVYWTKARDLTLDILTVVIIAVVQSEG
jgi:hypothetical protein